MKKIVAILMCLIMVLSLFSCNNKNISDNENNDITADTSSGNKTNEFSNNYKEILDMYRSIIEILPNYVDSKEAMDNYCAELGIIDEEGKELFSKLFGSTFDFKKSPPYKFSCGYATKDLNADGVDELVLLNNDYMIIAIFSYADEKPVLLGNYISRGRCWIDGDGLLHENGSSGADQSTNTVYKIADGGGKLELIAEFGTNGHEWVGDVAYTKYYKLVDGERVDISEAEWSALHTQYGKYLGYYEGVEVTKEYSGLTFTPLFDEADIAMEMFDAVLENKIKVYETDIDEYNYIKDCKTPYNRILLSQTDSLEYAFVDMDEDSVDELVIDCGDTLILRYYEGSVYLYPFTFRAMYYLQTDGSFSWNHTGQDFEYGESKLVFEGDQIETKELWRIVNDGEPNAEYYIDGKQVSEEEILKYFEDNPKTKIEFSSLEVSWQNKVSCLEALALAEEYWEGFNIEQNGYRVELGVDSWAPSSVYVVLLRHWVIDHYSTIDEIWIDVNTGETIVPYAPDGKG